MGLSKARSSGPGFFTKSMEMEGGEIVRKRLWLKVVITGGFAVRVNADPDNYLKHNKEGFYGGQKDFFARV
jgi:hypothetical protein